MNYIKNHDFDVPKLDWWLEIKTVVPEFIYFFGPFSSKIEAQVCQYEHIENLIQGKYRGITVELKN